MKGHYKSLLWALAGIAGICAIVFVLTVPPTWATSPVPAAPATCISMRGPDPRMMADDCSSASPVDPPASASMLPSASVSAPEPTGEPSASAPEPSASASGTETDSGPGSATPTPSTAAGEWGIEVYKSAKFVKNLVEGALGEGVVAPGSDTYGVTFALGLVIFVIVMIFLLMKASRGGYDPRVRQEMTEALPRIVTYVPLMLCIPNFVYLLFRFSVEMGDAFYNDGNNQAIWHWDKEGWGIGDILNAPVIGIAVGFAAMMFWTIFVIEDQVAQASLYILTVLVPITAALSLWPKNRRIFWRIIGVIIGCAMVPPATRFAYWLMRKMVVDMQRGHSGWMDVMLITVIHGVCTCLPIFLGYFMPAISPYGSNASGGGAGDWRVHTRGAGRGAVQSGLRAGNRTRNLIGRLTGKDAGKEAGGGGSSPGAAVTNTTSSEAGTSVASGGGRSVASSGGGAGGAGGKAAGAAGKAGLFAGAAVGALVGGIMLADQGRKAVQTKAREMALQNYQAAGGGQASAGPSGGEWRDRRSWDRKTPDEGGTQNSERQGEGGSRATGPSYSDRYEEMPKRRSSRKKTT